jgi:putative ABC transport system permease protein
LRLNDLLSVSIRQVARHRRRYVGVVLAIALGVAGVITIVTMSREIKNACYENLKLIGGVTIIRVSFDNRHPTHPDMPPKFFQERTLRALGCIPGVKEMSLTGLQGAHAYWHGNWHGFELMAVDALFWRVWCLQPLAGRFINPDASNGRKRECVLGEIVAERIFGTTQVVGQILEINQDSYRIVGVLGGVAAEGALAYYTYLPITTAQDRLSGTQLLTDCLYLRCRTWDDVPRIASTIPEVIKAHQSPEDLRVEVRWEALKRVQLLAWWTEFLIYLGTSATFILGGVGIWNVMMAAVTSRTREIGLKKAMGAEDRDILAQFLVEALCLSFVGLLAGAALGRILIEMLARGIDSRLHENLFPLGLGLGFLLAASLGLGAGLYPALRASRMEVVSALRHE